MENGRAYVAKLQWKGAEKPFRYGTFFVRLGATQQEKESAAVASIRNILPNDFPDPDVVQLLPGMLVFLPETDRAA